MRPLASVNTLALMSVDKLSQSASMGRRRVDVLKQGTLVMVDPRFWPGMNKEGGVARVERVNQDGTVNVKYVVVGGRDRNIPPACIHVTAADETLTPTTRSSRSQHNNAALSVMRTRRAAKEATAASVEDDKTDTSLSDDDLRPSMSRHGRRKMVSYEELVGDRDVWTSDEGDGKAGDAAETPQVKRGAEAKMDTRTTRSKTKATLASPPSPTNAKRKIHGQAAPTTEAKEPKVGQFVFVEAKMWAARDPANRGMGLAMVTTAHADGSCDVLYTDGDIVERGIPREFIKMFGNTQPLGLFDDA
ncbi:Aste57867_12351 [Aphanomyces stellatus]|uniref:Aste57867_12351 protein n=1 Tax=Aphanomyces stellatus TaxID=120398 RepID=A0A485KVR3_9STRA|nr:hypothetical protein As57867_012305 [Aphanomyces stellatus]VFT89203.1 Aste57867_12351 [Aphanomyces stellatus]